MPLGSRSRLAFMLYRSLRKGTLRGKIYQTLLVAPRSLDWQSETFLGMMEHRNSCSQSFVASSFIAGMLGAIVRASLMTGRDTFLTGMQFGVIEDAAPWGLPLDEVTLAERFKAAGYATHTTGKWHLGAFSDQHYPFRRGFDTFLGFVGGSEGYVSHEVCSIGQFEGAKYVCYQDFGYGDEDGYIDESANTTRLGPAMVGQYSTDIVTQRAIKVAKEHVAMNEGREDNAHTPLFLYLAYQAVHSPVDHPPDGSFTEEELELLQAIASEQPIRQSFAKVILYLDKMIAFLMKQLEELGMMKNTLVVVASDNGACPSGGGSNFPYRGMKHTLFEGGVHVPAMVYSTSESLIPGEVRGTSYGGLMHAMDWTPTLANVAGLPLESMGKPLTGFDHWPAITSNRSEAEGSPLRKELVLGRSSWDFDAEYTNSMVCESCVSDCDKTTENDFLFNLADDPYELVNLIEDMPDKFEQLKMRWDEVCKDEVVPQYRAEERQALEKWAEYNDWVVAWK